DRGERLVHRREQRLVERVAFLGTVERDGGVVGMAFDLENILGHESDSLSLRKLVKLADGAGVCGPSIARPRRALQGSMRLSAAAVKRSGDDADELVGDVDDLLRLLAVEMACDGLAAERERGVRLFRPAGRD